MKKIFKFLIIILCVFLLIVDVLKIEKIFAFSIISEPIIIKDALRGTEIIEDFTILNSDNVETTYQISAIGEIANWVQFYSFDDKKLENPISEITLPPNQGGKFLIKIKIPEDTPNGDYKGAIEVTSIPKDSSGNFSVSLALKLYRDVEITVTDKENLDLETWIIPRHYTIQPGDFLEVKVVYYNKGNVYIKPSLQLKIFSLPNKEIVHNAIYPYPEEELPVKPFEKKEFENLIKWPTTGQKKGPYKAEIRVLVDGKEYEKYEFRFKIGRSFRELLIASISTLGGGNFLLGWFVLGAIFALIAGILTILHKNPQILEKIKNFRINKQL